MRLYSPYGLLGDRAKHPLPFNQEKGREGGGVGGGEYEWEWIKNVEWDGNGNGNGNKNWNRNGNRNKISNIFLFNLSPYMSQILFVPCKRHGDICAT
jgi:hypothetical protein